MGWHRLAGLLEHNWIMRLFVVTCITTRNELWRDTLEYKGFTPNRRIWEKTQDISTTSILNPPNCFSGVATGNGHILDGSVLYDIDQLIHVVRRSNLIQA